MDKNSIFYALYYGAVAPWENSNLFLSKEHKETLDIANDLQEKLTSQLGDESKKLLDEFLKTDAKIGSFFEEEKFKDGFILGARLMIETLTDTRFTK
ncbi:DUF6809 family protein [Chakrabartyella piscis]|uniref:DUF6809 family protein n=1 Tax=Chakrabartyella piscis TaxID=2918914 RepID=UPI00295844FE|nr:DUF6809 family protein [Chakrabartyella piscis]